MSLDSLEVAIKKNTDAVKANTLEQVLAKQLLGAVRTSVDALTAEVKTLDTLGLATAERVGIVVGVLNETVKVTNEFLARVAPVPSPPEPEAESVTAEITLSELEK